MTHIGCKDFAAELGNLLEDDVSPELRAQLEEHLSVCRHCTVLYDSTRKTVLIVTETNSFELSPEQLKTTTDQVMARIRGAK